MHTTDHGRVLPGNERAYHDEVMAFGQPAMLRQLYVARAGHCAFSDSEMVVGFQVLFARLQSGKWAISRRRG